MSTEPYKQYRLWMKAPSSGGVFFFRTKASKPFILEHSWLRYYNYSPSWQISSIDSANGHDHVEG